MICTRCHSKITQTIVVKESNTKFLFATECKSCGLIRYFTKYQHQKLLERGRQLFKGPVGYWARKKFDFVFKSQLENTNGSSRVGAWKLFINKQKEQENKQVIKLLDEHDLRYVVHKCKDGEQQKELPYLYGENLNAIGIERIRKALESY